MFVITKDTVKELQKTRAAIKRKWTRRGDSAFSLYGALGRYSSVHFFAPSYRLVGCATGRTGQLMRFNEEQRTRKPVIAALTKAIELAKANLGREARYVVP